MIRTTLTIAAILCALPSQPAHAQTHAPSPCSLLTVAQMNAVVGTQVQPGQPGQPGSSDCTWRNSKGQTVVYLSLKGTDDFHSTRSQMQATGKMVPITGVGEDAFFVSSTGSSAALYTLKKHRVMLLTVDGLGFSKAENEAAEKALATQALSRF